MHAVARGLASSQVESRRGRPDQSYCGHKSVGYTVAFRYDTMFPFPTPAAAGRNHPRIRHPSWKPRYVTEGSPIHQTISSCRHHRYCCYFCFWILILILLLLLNSRAGRRTWPCRTMARTARQRASSGVDPTGSAVEPSSGRLSYTV